MTLINLFQQSIGRIGRIYPCFQDFFLDPCSRKNLWKVANIRPIRPIFEIQERFEDSVDVYNTIKGTYQDKELIKQAGIQLANIKL